MKYSEIHARKCKNMANLVTIKTRIFTSGLRSQVG